jgi:hypothetical protein
MLDIGRSLDVSATSPQIKANQSFFYRIEDARNNPGGCPDGIPPERDA